MFVFGDPNFHHKDWRTNSGGTDISGELLNNLTQIANFLVTSQTVTLSPALLELFLSLDASIYSTIASPLLANSDHVIVSVSIDFLSNSQLDTLFYGIAYDYSCADWEGLCDHLRDVPWEDIFKLSCC